MAEPIIMAHEPRDKPTKIFASSGGYVRIMLAQRERVTLQSALLAYGTTRAHALHRAIHEAGDVDASS